MKLLSNLEVIMDSFQSYLMSDEEQASEKQKDENALKKQRQEMGVKSLLSGILDITYWPSTAIDLLEINPFQAAADFLSYVVWIGERIC